MYMIIGNSINYIYKNKCYHPHDEKIFFCKTEKDKENK